MRSCPTAKRVVAALATFLFIAGALPLAAAADQPDAPGAIELAQDDGTRSRELEPRYTPAPVEEPSSYNSSYIFGMTRGIADSTLHPAAKIPLFVLTIPLDLVFLPFEAIGGLF